MDALYRDFILEHYKSPRNFGDLEPHDLEWHDHNPLCGDELGVHIVVEDGRVKDLTGQIWVPVLETDDGEVVQGSDKIVAWAKANPATASDATRAS